MGSRVANRSPLDRSARWHQQLADEEGDYSSAIEALRDAPQNDTLTLDLALAYGRANDARQGR